VRLQRRREEQHGRPEAAEGLQDGLDGHVPAQVVDAVAVGRPHAGGHAQPEIVRLSGHARGHDHPPRVRRVGQAQGQLAEHVADQRRHLVLLADRQPAGRPAVAHRVERRAEHLLEQPRQGQAGLVGLLDRPPGGARLPG